MNSDKATLIHPFNKHSMLLRSCLSYCDIKYASGIKQELDNKFVNNAIEVEYHVSNI